MGISVTCKIGEHKMSEIIPNELYDDIYNSFGLEANNVIKEFIIKKGLNKFVQRITGMKYTEIAELSEEEKMAIIENAA